jgi:hypothetical protein
MMCPPIFGLADSHLRIYTEREVPPHIRSLAGFDLFGGIVAALDKITKYDVKYKQSY